MAKWKIQLITVEGEIINELIFEHMQHMEHLIRINHTGDMTYIHTVQGLQKSKI